MVGAQALNVQHERGLGNHGRPVMNREKRKQAYDQVKLAAEDLPVCP